MELSCNNRLVVLGPAEQLDSFDSDSDWTTRLEAQHLEVYEVGPHRRTWWFETNEPPVQELRNLSADWPGLTFFLNYEHEDAQRFGLVLAKGGRLQSCFLDY